jgi:hypothetical protein
MLFAGILTLMFPPGLVPTGVVPPGVVPPLPGFNNKKAPTQIAITTTTIKI